MAKFYFSPTKQKVALLLLTGLTLGLSHSPRKQWQLVRTLPRAWRDIDRKVLRRMIREFEHGRLIDFRLSNDGSAIITLTELGRKYALRYKIDELAIPTSALWDKKWRMVVFDIPERKKRGREALRNKLSELGFLQLQKSVWIFPYPCKDIIDFVVEVFELRQYVQYFEAIAQPSDAKLL